MSSFYFPELKRPQYPSSPEILLSALAWSVVERPSSAPEAGLIYVRKESKAKRGVQIRQTKPKDGDELASFTAALLNAGVRTKDGGLPSLVVDAIADSLVGVRSDKGVGYTSSAIGLCGALLQDPIGGLGAANPPNFANLLNTMYALGEGVVRPRSAGSTLRLIMPVIQCSVALRRLSRGLLCRSTFPRRGLRLRRSWLKEPNQRLCQIGGRLTS